MLSPHDKMQYPQTLWNPADAEDPPAAERNNPTQNWPDGTPYDEFPPGFIVNSLDTYINLPNQMFEYVANRWGQPYEFLGVKGKIYRFAQRTANAETLHTGAINAGTTWPALKQACQELGLYPNALKLTQSSKTTHSTELAKDEKRKERGRFLFQSSLGEPFWSAISSFIPTDSFPLALARLDALYMKIGECTTLLNQLEGLLGQPGTFAHCRSIHEYELTFESYLVSLESLKHNMDMTPPIDCPSLDTIRQHWRKTEFDFIVDCPGIARKVSYTTIKTLFVKGFSHGRFATYSERFMVEDKTKGIPDIIQVLLDAERVKNLRIQDGTASAKVRVFSTAVSPEADTDDRLFSLLEHNTSLSHFSLSDSSVSGSSNSGHTSGEFSELSDEMTQVYASFAKNPNKYGPATKCTICSSARDAELRAKSHDHTMAFCPKLPLLSTLTDKEANKQGFPSASQAGLPGTYSSFYSNRNKTLPTHSSKTKPTSSSTCITQDQFNSEMNQLVDILVPSSSTSSAPAKKRTFINFIGTGQVSTSTDPATDTGPPKL